MPRFVILEHDFPALHWDLMLERGSVLRTWRLLRFPGGNDPEIPAEPTFDHRPVYLDYEGPVSGGRGSVIRWDQGTHEVLEESEGYLRVQLLGSKLNGVFAVLRQSDAGWVFRAER